jgi:hypothetical protein
VICQIRQSQANDFLCLGSRSEFRPAGLIPQTVRELLSESQRVHKMIPDRLEMMPVRVGDGDDPRWMGEHRERGEDGAPLHRVTSPPLRLLLTAHYYYYYYYY